MHQQMGEYRRISSMEGHKQAKFYKVYFGESAHSPQSYVKIEETLLTHVILHRTNFKWRDKSQVWERAGVWCSKTDIYLNPHETEYSESTRWACV